MNALKKLPIIMIALLTCVANADGLKKNVLGPVVAVEYEITPTYETCKGKLVESTADYSYWCTIDLRELKNNRNQFVKSTFDFYESEGCEASIEVTPYGWIGRATKMRGSPIPMNRARAELCLRDAFAYGWASKTYSALFYEVQK